MIEKPVRIIDENLLEECRQIPCVACSCRNPDEALAAMGDGIRRSHPHHIISRGAGGGDTVSNVIPLCAWCHREIHQIGLLAFSENNALVKRWLEVAGWERNPDGQWLRPD